MLGGVGATLLADLHMDVVAGIAVDGSVLGQVVFSPLGVSEAQSGVALPLGFQSSFTADGLVEMGSRFYLASQGTFASRDSFSGLAKSPLTTNRYLYANANPINGVDISGHSSTPVLSGDPCLGNDPIGPPDSGSYFGCRNGGPVPGPAPGPFNGAGAARWAVANGPFVTGGWYVPDGDDCTQFVSTALLMGGMIETHTWNSMPWTNGLPFATPIMGTPTYRTSGLLEGWLISTGRAKYVIGGTHRSYYTQAQYLAERPKPAGGPGKPKYKAPAGIKPGDLIFYLWANAAAKGGVPAPNHSAMVTAINPLRIAHHNDHGKGKGGEAIWEQYKRAALNPSHYLDSKNRLVMRFVHIVKTG